jgi:hypothetical protein
MRNRSGTGLEKKKSAGRLVQRNGCRDRYGPPDQWPTRNLADLQSWLGRRYYEERKGGVCRAIRSALNLLEAQAYFDAPERAVYIRVAVAADRAGKGLFCPFLGLGPSPAPLQNLVLSGTTAQAVVRTAKPATPQRAVAVIQKIAYSANQHTIFWLSP